MRTDENGDDSRAPIEDFYSNLMIAICCLFAAITDDIHGYDTEARYYAQLNWINRLVMR